jgi:hypothetical protein
MFLTASLTIDKLCVFIHISKGLVNNSPLHILKKIIRVRIEPEENFQNTLRTHIDIT